MGESRTTERAYRLRVYPTRRKHSINRVLPGFA